MKRWLAAVMVALAVPVAPTAAQNLNAQIVQTGQGYRVGDAEAPLQIIEFVSYSCPHCAAFEREAEAELRYHYVHEGYAAVEVRHMIRNPIDLSAALLTECGSPDRFFDNHRAVLATQDSWMETARSLTPSQMQRWANGAIGSRMRAIASDLGFDDLMEQRGYSRSEIDACLTDEARAQEIAETSQANVAEYDVPGTPSFVLNGNLLDSVHTWNSLKQVLLAAREQSE